jgi:hypothetical protein
VASVDLPAGLCGAIALKLAELKVCTKKITASIVTPSSGEDMVIQDRYADNDSVSVVMALQSSVSVAVFAGCYDVADYKTKKTFKIDNSNALFFRDRLVYSLTTPAAYIHCACSVSGSAPLTCAPVATRLYACPFKPALAENEVRGKSKRLSTDEVSPTDLGCEYSAKRWKNVLDHLENCRHNPDIERRKLKQAKRKQHKLVEVACEVCGQSFTNKNSYVKHKTRKHSWPHRSAEPISVDDLNALLGLYPVSPSSSTKNQEPAAIVEPPIVHTVEAPALQIDAVAANAVDKASAPIYEELNIVETSPPSNASPKSNAFGANKLIRAPTHLKRRPKSHEVQLADPPVYAFNDRDRIYAIVQDVFAEVTKADIRQPAGKREHNASEMSMCGVSAMLEALDIKDGDVFLDVGSGVGNVIVQAALETDSRMCVGVEMRSELVSVCKRLIASYGDERLDRVVVQEADITKEQVEVMHPVIQATHLFCHNTLFTEESKLALAELCWLPRLRHIALSELLCPRHTARCQRPICRFWHVTKIIKVKVTYAHAPVPIHIMSRKTEDVVL